MKRLLVVILVAAIFVGCNKRDGTDGKPQAKANTPAQKSSPIPKKEEPPRLSPRHKFKTGIPEISRLAITDDGSRLSASSDGLGNKGQMQIWDLRPEPKKVRDIPGVLRAFAPDGKLLTRSAKESGHTDVVDANTGAVVRVIPSAGHFQQFIGPEQIVIVWIDSAGNKNRGLVVSIYSVRTGKQEGGFEIPSTSLTDIRGPVNGRKEIVVGWKSTSRVEVWDLGTGKMVRGVTLPNALPDGGWVDFEASPDGKRVAVRRRTDYEEIYDTTTGSEIARISRLNNTRFVPGRELILGRDSWIGDKSQFYSGLRAYDLTKKQIVADLLGAYLSPAISADGRVMASKVDRARPDLQVWDLTQIP